MRIKVSIKRVIRVLSLILVCLFLTNLAAMVYKLEPFIGFGSQLGFEGGGTIETFDFEVEASLPAWYSSFTLLLCSGLLVVIAGTKKQAGERYSRHWYTLSSILLLMSIDETVTIHEKVGSAVRGWLHVGGVLYYAWVIPAAVFLLVFALVMYKFFFDLPFRTRWLFLIAGIIYVGGALVLETVEGYHNYHYSTSDATSAILGSGQELLEMLGILVFIYALLSYISIHLRRVVIYIDMR